MKEKYYQRRGIRMFAQMRERLMSCWGSLSNTAWRIQWEICCLLICSVQVLCQRGSGGGYSTLLSTFLRNSEAAAALKSSTKTCPGSTTRTSLMTPSLDFSSQRHEPTFNLLNCALKTCWSLRPLSSNAMTPLPSSQVNGDNYSPSKPRGGTPGI